MARQRTVPTEAQLSPRRFDDNDAHVDSRPPPYDETGHDYGAKYEYDPNFDGPVKKRSCTDILCLLLFVAFLGGWGFVAFVGFSNGDISKILYPTDTLGRICGRGDLSSKPYLVFFDLTKCLNLAVLSSGCPTPQVCVEKCPTETFSGYALANAEQEKQAKDKMKPFCQTMTDETWRNSRALDLIQKGLCPAWVLPSRAILGRCLPIGSTKNDTESVVPENQTLDGKPVKGYDLTRAIYALSTFLNARDLGERIFNDLGDTWWMIGLAFIGCSILSFFWILLMRIFAGFMVWTSIGLVFLLVSGLLGYSVYRYILVKDIAGSILEVNFTPNYLEDVLSLRDTWLAFVIILAIVAVCILLILIALRQRIQIAIELIEEGSKCVGQNLGSIFFPMFPFVVHVLIVVWYAAVSMYLSSSGTSVYMVNYVSENPLHSSCTISNCINPESGQTYIPGDKCVAEIFNKTCLNCPQITCQFAKHEKSQLAFYLQWANLFALFWSLNFVSAFSEMVLAGVFATWYWALDKSRVPCCNLGRSFCNVLTYHLGTVAFGSLIIAIIQIIRWILTQVENKLKSFNNDLTRCLLCMCKCCLWCLEKFMRFINRNAYIMCAMKGTNFCSSAKSAFNLLMRNVLRVVVLNRVVDFLLFLGKLVIVTGVGAMSYFVFARQIPDLKDTVPNLNYFFMPVIFIVIGSYFITSSFFGVYSMAVDTLFLCFLEDLERNDGTPERPYSMSKHLRQVVGVMQKFNDDQSQPLRPIRPQSR